MVFRDLMDEEQVRLRVMLLAMLAAFGLLAVVLSRMQVAHGSAYQRDLLKQSARRVRLPGMRGRIFDRNEACIADNRPSYCIAIYLEELRQPGKWSRTIGKVEDLIEEIAEVIGLPPQIGPEDIKTHVNRRLPLPLLVWRDIDMRALAAFQERIGSRPGVDIYAEAVRDYPFKRTGCHVIGYVGRADPPKNEEEPFHYYIAEMIGRSGIEKRFDGVLRGAPGGQLVRVDVSGFRHGDIAIREPTKGRDVILSVDMKIQGLVEEALGEDRGAGVVIDPTNGDVLALASSPGFDLNQFVPFIPTKLWRALSDDEGKPLLNRAAAGIYAPGSIFKPVVAAAALESGKITPGTSFNCPGSFSLGRATFGCWHRPGHGMLNMRESLMHSCNVYFFRAALQCGPEAITHMAAALGLGRKTDISLDHELAGLLPDDAWKRRVHNDGWRDGDTCNLSIGQGALGVTPLQMGMIAAALANGGRLYRPRIVLGVREGDDDIVRSVPPHIVNEMNWAPATIRTIREGMRDSVMAARGTGRLAAVPGMTMAGKTGTAEYGRKGDGLNLAWMICFWPYEQPRYAMALMVEEGISGGSTAAPRVGRIVKGIEEASRKGAG